MKHYFHIDNIENNNYSNYNLLDNYVLNNNSFKEDNYSKIKYSNFLIEKELINDLIFHFLIKMKKNDRLYCEFTLGNKKNIFSNFGFNYLFNYNKQNYHKIINSNIYSIYKFPLVKYLYFCCYDISTNELTLYDFKNRLYINSICMNTIFSDNKYINRFDYITYDRRSSFNRIISNTPYDNIINKCNNIYIYSIDRVIIDSVTKSGCVLLIYSFKRVIELNIIKNCVNYLAKYNYIDIKFNELNNEQLIDNFIYCIDFTNKNSINDGLFYFKVFIISKDRIDNKHIMYIFEIKEYSEFKANLEKSSNKKHYILINTNRYNSLSNSVYNKVDDNNENCDIYLIIDMINYIDFTDVLLDTKLIVYNIYVNSIYHSIYKDKLESYSDDFCAYSIGINLTKNNNSLKSIDKYSRFVYVYINHLNIVKRVITYNFLNCINKDSNIDRISYMHSKLIRYNYLDIITIINFNYNYIAFFSIKENNLISFYIDKLKTSNIFDINSVFNSSKKKALYINIHSEKNINKKFAYSISSNKNLSPIIFNKYSIINEDLIHNNNNNNIFKDTANNKKFLSSQYNNQNSLSINVKNYELNCKDTCDILKLQNSKSKKIENKEYNRESKSISNFKNINNVNLVFYFKNCVKVANGYFKLQKSNNKYKIKEIPIFNTVITLLDKLKNITTSIYNSIYVFDLNIDELFDYSLKFLKNNNICILAKKRYEIIFKIIDEIFSYSFVEKPLLASVEYLNYIINIVLNNNNLDKYNLLLLNNLFIKPFLSYSIKYNSLDKNLDTYSNYKHLSKSYCYLKPLNIINLNHVFKDSKLKSNLSDKLILLENVDFGNNLNSVKIYEYLDKNNYIINYFILKLLFTPFKKENKKYMFVQLLKKFDVSNNIKNIKLLINLIMFKYINNEMCFEKISSNIDFKNIKLLCNFFYKNLKKDKLINTKDLVNYQLDIVNRLNNFIKLSSTLNDKKFLKLSKHNNNNLINNKKLDINFYNINKYFLNESEVYFYLKMLKKIIKSITYYNICNYPFKSVNIKCFALNYIISYISIYKKHKCNINNEIFEKSFIIKDIIISSNNQKNCYKNFYKLNNDNSSKGNKTCIFDNFLYNVFLTTLFKLKNNFTADIIFKYIVEKINNISFNNNLMSYKVNNLINIENSIIYKYSLLINVNTLANNISNIISEYFLINKNSNITNKNIHTLYSYSSIMNIENNCSNFNIRNLKGLKINVYKLISLLSSNLLDDILYEKSISFIENYYEIIFYTIDSTIKMHYLRLKYNKFDYTLFNNIYNNLSALLEGNLNILLKYWFENSKKLSNAYKLIFKIILNNLNNINLLSILDIYNSNIKSIKNLIINHSIITKQLILINDNIKIMSALVYIFNYMYLKLNCFNNNNIKDIVLLNKKFYFENKNDKIIKSILLLYFNSLFINLNIISTKKIDNSEQCFLIYKYSIINYLLLSFYKYTISIDSQQIMINIILEILNSYIEKIINLDMLQNHKNLAFNYSEIIFINLLIVKNNCNSKSINLLQKINIKSIEIYNKFINNNINNILNLDILETIYLKFYQNKPILDKNLLKYFSNKINIDWNEFKDNFYIFEKLNENSDISNFHKNKINYNAIFYMLCLLDEKFIEFIEDFYSNIVCHKLIDNNIDLKRKINENYCNSMKFNTYLYQNIDFNFSIIEFLLNLEDSSNTVLNFSQSSINNIFNLNYNKIDSFNKSLNKSNQFSFKKINNSNNNNNINSLSLFDNKINDTKYSSIKKNKISFLNRSYFDIYPKALFKRYSSIEDKKTKSLSVEISVENNLNNTSKNNLLPHFKYNSKYCYANKKVDNRIFKNKMNINNKNFSFTDNCFNDNALKNNVSLNINNNYSFSKQKYETNNFLYNMKNINTHKNLVNFNNKKNNTIVFKKVITADVKPETRYNNTFLSTSESNKILEKKLVNKYNEDILKKKYVSVKLIVNFLQNKYNFNTIKYIDNCFILIKNYKNVNNNILRYNFIGVLNKKKKIKLSYFNPKVNFKTHSNLSKGNEDLATQTKEHKLISNIENNNYNTLHIRNSYSKIEKPNAITIKADYFNECNNENNTHHINSNTNKEFNKNNILNNNKNQEHFNINNDSNNTKKKLKKNRFGYSLYYVIGKNNNKNI